MAQGIQIAPAPAGVKEYHLGKLCLRMPPARHALYSTYTSLGGQATASPSGTQAKGALLPMGEACELKLVRPQCNAAGMRFRGEVDLCGFLPFAVLYQWQSMGQELRAI